MPGGKTEQDSHFSFSVVIKSVPARAKLSSFPVNQKKISTFTINNYFRKYFSSIILHFVHMLHIVREHCVDTVRGLWKELEFTEFNKR